MSALDVLSAAKNPPVSTMERAKDGQSKAEKGAIGLAGDFQNFLLLLTTQLKYQDPTAPMDTNQFTQQLATFAGVEQQVNANKNLETLINLQSGGEFGGALSYLGKEIEADGNALALNGGKATMSFDIAGNPMTTEITVRDSTGKTIATQEIQGQTGSNVVYWDGTTSLGSKAPDGAYTYEIVAKNSNGNPLTTKTYTAGLVTGVFSDASGPQLAIGDVKVPTGKVVAVHEPEDVPSDS